MRKWAPTQDLVPIAATYHKTLGRQRKISDESDWADSGSFGLARDLSQDLQDHLVDIFTR